jgi:hypothetical protein
MESTLGVRALEGWVSIVYKAVDNCYVMSCHATHGCVLGELHVKGGQVGRVV